MDSDSSLESAPTGSPAAVTNEEGSPREGRPDTETSDRPPSSSSSSSGSSASNHQTARSPIRESPDRNKRPVRVKSPIESGPESPPLDDNPPSSPHSRVSSGGSIAGDDLGPDSPADVDKESGEEDENSRHSSEQKQTFKPHAKEDLSDVSDLESQDGFDEPVSSKLTSHDNLDELDFEAEEGEEPEVRPRGDVEKSDFIEESAPVKEEVKEEGEEGEEEAERSDGEVKDGEDLEEGECTDGDDPRPEETEPRPICRFYNRGQCTWGSNCRFVHPGVTDKGNYCMFDMVRPLVPANGPPPPNYIDPRYEKVVPPVGAASAYPAVEPQYESSWERGLRHAKEMMRKATKRKESDMDFEEKKLNLGLGQEDLDKENDFYTRPASPIITSRLEPEQDKWSRYEDEEEYYDSYRSRSHPGPPPGDWPPPQRRSGGHYPPPESRGGMRPDLSPYERGGPPPPHRRTSTEKYHSSRGMPPEVQFHREQRRQQHYAQQHANRQGGADQPPSPKWRGEDHRQSDISRHPDGPPHKGARGDEWSDPWMRSKSPTRKPGQRRHSYSSGSSYTSSSRSSSRSSYSSYSSRSRSRSFSRSPGRGRGGGGHSPPPAGRGKVGVAATPSKSTKSPGTRAIISQEPPPGRPKQNRNQPPNERKGGVVRTMPTSPPALAGERKMMPQSARRRPEHSPPPPPPQRRPTTPPLQLEDKPKNWSPPMKSAPGTKSGRKGLKGKKPTSESEDSGTSSDSASSTSSTASSSDGPPRTHSKPAKKIIIDGREALANMMKIKALDALKVSGQKQQIKLTLKGSEASKLDRIKDAQLLSSLSRKRAAAEARLSSSPEDSKGSKKNPSRREELLKQLKAVEDAIRRKRFKLN